LPIILTRLSGSCRSGTLSARCCVRDGVALLSFTWSRPRRLHTATPCPFTSRAPRRRSPRRRPARTTAGAWRCRCRR
jgi:hypothetical protein